MKIVAGDLCARHIGCRIQEKGYPRGKRSSREKVLRWWEISMITHGRKGKVKVRTANNGHVDYTFDARDIISVSPPDPASSGENGEGK